MFVIDSEGVDEELTYELIVLIGLIFSDIEGDVKSHMLFNEESR